MPSFAVVKHLNVVDHMGSCVVTSCVDVAPKYLSHGLLKKIQIDSRPNDWNYKRQTSLKIFDQPHINVSTIVKVILSFPQSLQERTKILDDLS